MIADDKDSAPGAPARARPQAWKVAPRVGLAALVIILFVVSGIPDCIDHHFQSRRYAEFNRHVDLLQTAYLAVLGRHGGLPDGRTLGSEVAEIVGRHGEVGDREYLVAVIDGRTYFAEVPSGRGEGEMVVVYPGGSITRTNTGSARLAAATDGSPEAPRPPDDIALAGAILSEGQQVWP